MLPSSKWCSFLSFLDAYQWRLGFSKPLGLWSFCSPWLIRWWQTFPYPFQGYGFFFFIFLLLLFQAGKVNSRCLVWRSGQPYVSSTFGRIFTVFYLIFGARSTYYRWLLQDTRPSAAFPVILRSRCQKNRSCWSSEISAWSRQRAFCSLARVTAMLRLFRPCTVAARVYDIRSKAGCYCLRRSQPLLHCWRLVFGFFFCFVCLYIPLVFPITICLCIAQILLKYLLTSC